MKTSHVAALLGAAGLAGVAAFSRGNSDDSSDLANKDAQVIGAQEVVISEDLQLSGFHFGSENRREVVESLQPELNLTSTENISAHDKEEDRLHSVLSSIRGTFLTQNPNIASLHTLVKELVHNAQVDEDSIDPRPNGDLEGRLLITGSELTASYTISKGGGYQVVFSDKLTPGESPFDYFRLTVGFHIDADVSEADGFRLSAPHYRVQFVGLPGNVKNASGNLVYGDRTLQGWHFMIQPDGSTKASPIIHAMPGDDTSISDPAFYPQEFEAWSADRAPHKDLFAKLGTLAQ